MSMLLPKSNTPFLSKIIYICPACQWPCTVSQQVQPRDVLCPKCQKTFFVEPPSGAFPRVGPPAG